MAADAEFHRAILSFIDKSDSDSSVIEYVILWDYSKFP